MSAAVTQPFAYRGRLCTWLLAACLFAIVLGLKWATFNRYGSAMPDWDQWDAEGSYLLVPWFEHDQPFLKALFEPHNEHRVVMTKLQNLGLTLLNGQWDSRLEAVVNAILHSVLAAAFWLVGRRWFHVAQASPPAPNRAGGTPVLLDAVLFLAIVVLFGVPLAWQNVLGGFHSQQYWLLGLSFAAIVALPFVPTWSVAWWAAAAAMVLAMFTMGSGFLAAVVVLALVAWRLVARQTTLRAAWPTLLLAVVLIAIGMATRVEVPHHQALKAKTAHDFVFSILRSLEWPLRDADWAGVVMWLPIGLVTWRALRGREIAASHAVQTMLGLAAWVLIQIVATAYARGAGADYPAIRYMDTLAVGALVNVLAFAWLCTEPRTRRATIGFAALGVAWLVGFGIGLRELLDRCFVHELPTARRYYDAAERHMLGYFSTMDPKQLEFPDIPYPSAGSLIERAERPSLRQLMPVELRPSLPLKAADNAAAGANARGFIGNVASELTIERAPRVGISPATPPLATRPTWGSFGPRGAAETGEWRSAPLTAPLQGWLKFEMAGDAGEPGVALELRDAATDALLANVRPSKRPGDSWRAAYVRAPARPFVVVARDADPQRWLAFAAPAERAELSHLAWRVARQGWWLALVGGAAAAALAIVALCRVGPALAAGPSRNERDGRDGLPTSGSPTSSDPARTG